MSPTRKHLRSLLYRAGIAPLFVAIALLIFSHIRGTILTWHFDYYRGRLPYDSFTFCLATGRLELGVGHTLGQPFLGDGTLSWHAVVPVFAFFNPISADEYKSAYLEDWHQWLYSRPYPGGGIDDLGSESSSTLGVKFSSGGYESFLTLPLALFTRRQHHRHRRQARQAAGRCPACNYDCRITPTQCPECGHIFDVVSNASLSSN